MRAGRYHKTNNQIQEEYRLIEAAKKNPRRFGALYERYYKPVFIFVYKRVDDEEVSADITSQVFLKAMQALPKYQFKGLPFSSWLFRIAINETNQYFRATKNKRTVSMERADLKNIAEEVGEETNEDAIKMMLATLQELSPDDVQMIELRFFEKMSFREVAEVFNITENNAKVRTYRILKKMQKIMSRRKASV